MIEKEFVTFETAKMLKEAGFPQDEKYYARYNPLGQDWHMGDGYNYVLKPSQSVAMRWLREEHEVFVFIDGLDRAKEDGIKMYFRYRVGIRPYKYDKDLRREYCIGYESVESTYYTIPTYEEAAEAGIQAACKYLIEKGGDK